MQSAAVWQAHAGHHQAGVITPTNAPTFGTRHPVRPLLAGSPCCLTAALPPWLAVCILQVAVRGLAECLEAATGKQLGVWLVVIWAGCSCCCSRGRRAAVSLICTELRSTCKQPDRTTNREPWLGVFLRHRVTSLDARGLVGANIIASQTKKLCRALCQPLSSLLGGLAISSVLTAELFHPFSANTIRAIQALLLKKTGSLEHGSSTKHHRIAAAAAAGAGCRETQKACAAQPGRTAGYTRQLLWCYAASWHA